MQIGNLHPNESWHLVAGSIRQPIPAYGVPADEWQGSTTEAAFSSKIASCLTSLVVPSALWMRYDLGVFLMHFTLFSYSTSYRPVEKTTS